MSLLNQNKQVEQVINGTANGTVQECVIARTRILPRRYKFPMPETEEAILVEYWDRTINGEKIGKPSMLITQDDAKGNGYGRLVRRVNTTHGCAWAFIGKRKYWIARPFQATHSRLLRLYETAVEDQKGHHGNADQD